MERVLLELRSSLRIFQRSPGIALSAIIALAMGIGFTTTMFSIVHGGTRPLPFPEPYELVAITPVAPQGYDVRPAPFDYVEWAREQQSFDGLAAFASSGMNLSGDALYPDRRSGTVVTPNTFSLLGQPPMLGRTLLPEDATPGAPAVVLLGHALWQSRFAADSAIMGRTIRVNGTPRTVVGVMPPRFGFPVHSELWTPLTLSPNVQPSASDIGLTVFGRLRDGVSTDQARAEMATIALRMARQYPETHRDLSLRIMPFVETEMAPNTAALLYLMLGVVSFVLLIACANVANLLLARAAERTHEMAIRSALGARRAHIIAQQVLESLVLAVFGGLLGLAVAQVAVGFFARSTADIIEAFWIDFRIDSTVVLFSTVLIAVAGVLAGILPAWRATSADVSEVIKDTTGGTTGLRIGRLSKALIVGEVALVSGLLIMTMTFTKSAVALHAINMPFPADQIFTGQLAMLSGTLDDGEARVRMATDLSERLEAIPGVTKVAFTSVLPGRGAGNWSFALDGRPDDATTNQLTTGLAMVTPEFFEVLGARVMRGRGLESRDGPSAPLVAVVNASWVRQYSADRDPEGRHIWFGDTMLEIVGVVPDLQMQDLEDRNAAGVYASLLQIRPYVVRVMARTVGDPLTFTPAVLDAVNSVDPDLPVFEVASLHDAIYADKKVLDAFGTLFFLFGIGALFLTMVGLYGLVSFAVRQRRREIGIRVAVGAHSRDIVILVLRQGMPLVGIGASIGLVIAFALSHAMASQIEFIQPAGLLTYGTIVGTLGATALLGLLRPVRQALALQPMEAMRLE